MADLVAQQPKMMMSDVGCFMLQGWEAESGWVEEFGRPVMTTLREARWEVEFDLA